MPLVLADRVRDTTTTTGTGTVTLSGTAPTGYQNFSVIGNGNTTYYTINADSQWEVGIGTYSSTGPTLARTTVLESSNGNALVDFAAGTKDVFVTYPADRAVYQDGTTIAAGTAVLGVANGGTGVTTSTGTSSVVLSNSPTLVTPTLGAASATSIAAGLGAVGTPSYTFTGDLNTGMWSPAADTVAVSTAGTERMRITSAGLVQINTTSGGGQLNVNADSGAPSILLTNSATSNPYLAFANGNYIMGISDGTMRLYTAGAHAMTFGTNNTDRMRIDSAGNVGIGTTFPAQRLDVLSSGDTPAVFRSAGANTYFQFVNSVASAGYIGYSGSALTFWTSSERMRITAAGDVGVGTSAPVNKLQSAYNVPVSVPATGTVGGHGFAVGGGGFGIAAGALNNGNGYLQVTHWDGTSANYNLLLQPNGGNVGIGTTSPTRLLSVAGTANGYMDFSASSFRRYTIGSESRGFIIYDDTGSAYRMVINASGNVGIGTDAPSARLDVLGTTSDQLRLRTAATEEYRIGRNASTGLLDFYGSQTGFTGYVFGGIDGERMRITATGRVGIGTASPTTQLEVYGGASGTFTSVAVGNAATALQLAVDTSNNAQIRTAQSVNMQFFTAGTERMRIASTGEVGVNTTAPGTTFEVALSTSGLPGLRASRSGAQTQYIQMDIGGGASARLFATGGNKAMYIINNNSGAGLGTATDSTFIQVPGPSANTPITAMYIESSTANVGIGTTAPAGRVHATNTYTNTSNTNFIADGNIPGLNLRPANGRFSLLASYGAANTSSIVLGTGTANPSTEAMRFDHSTGGINVGAATPNAAAQLQVDSTTRGFLPPRMTTAQRDAIATPPNGLVLYNTSTDKLQVRAAGAWVDLH